MAYLGFAPLFLIAGLLSLAIFEAPGLIRWLARRQHRKFEKLSEPIQKCLDALIEAESSVELPWMLPDNWAFLRSQIIALEKELGFLDIPRPPGPESTDILVENFYGWMDYLSHLAPLAKHGLIEQARRVYQESRSSFDGSSDA